MAREGAASKMSATCTCIFYANEVKEKRYMMFIDVQREKMEFGREELFLEKNKVELERQEKVAKWELEQTVTMCDLELDKERLRRVRERQKCRGS